MKTMIKTGNARIRAAMRENERYVVAEIGRRGSYKPPADLFTLAIHHAIERLKKRGKIRFDDRSGGYVLVK